MTQPTTAGRRGRPPRPGRPGASRPGTITYNFASNRFVCNCRRFIDERFCSHMRDFFTEGRDIDEIFEAQSNARGVQRVYQVPICNGLIYIPAGVTVHHLPGISDNNGPFEVIVVTDIGSSNVECWLGPGEGLQVWLNAIADWYGSRLIYSHLLTQLGDRKDVPCTNQNHGSREYADLRRDLSNPAFNLPLVALANAYTMHNWSTCIHCHSFATDFSQDAPEL